MLTALERINNGLTPLKPKINFDYDVEAEK